MPLPPESLTWRPTAAQFDDLRDACFPSAPYELLELEPRVDQVGGELGTSMNVRMDVHLKEQIRAVARALRIRDSELVRRLLTSDMAQCGEFVRADAEVAPC